MNSKSILKACNNELAISGQKFITSTSNIAVSGSGYPTADRLSEKISMIASIVNYCCIHESDLRYGNVIIVNYSYYVASRIHSTVSW